MDEITTTASTLMAEVTPEGVRVETINPEQFGIARCTMEALRGGDAVANAAIVKSILGGEPGARRDIVLLNSAYALVAAGIVTAPSEGLALAAKAIDSGKALEQLQKLVELTNH
jgi:anthranilate phosphoribosyltransferase